MMEDLERGETSQAKILFVDDEKHVLTALKRIFLDQPYQVFTASSGAEGLLLLETEPDVQVVISDYRMPGMHGVDFLQKVRLQWPGTVRMVLSGYADISSVVAAVNEGQIYKFIHKPWDDDELRIAVANAAEKFSLQSKNRLLTVELKRMNEQLVRGNSSLSRIVAENTSNLVFQNKIYRSSHLILANLPAAVIGLNADNEIAVCNRNGAALLGVNEIAVIGDNRRKVFSEQLNAFAEEVLENGKACRVLTVNGADLKARGLVVKSGAESFVSLMFDEGC